MQWSEYPKCGFEKYDFDLFFLEMFIHILDRALIKESPCIFVNVILSFIQNYIYCILEFCYIYLMGILRNIDNGIRTLVLFSSGLFYRSQN